jgi:hypothetical protein
MANALGVISPNIKRNKTDSVIETLEATNGDNSNLPKIISPVIDNAELANIFPNTNAAKTRPYPPSINSEAKRRPRDESPRQDNKRARPSENNAVSEPEKKADPNKNNPKNMKSNNTIDKSSSPA